MRGRPGLRYAWGSGTRAGPRQSGGIWRAGLTIASHCDDRWSANCINPTAPVPASPGGGRGCAGPFSPQWARAGAPPTLEQAPGHYLIGRGHRPLLGGWSWRGRPGQPSRVGRVVEQRVLGFMAPVNRLPGVESVGPSLASTKGAGAPRAARGWRGTCMNFSGLGPGPPSLPGMEAGRVRAPRRSLPGVFFPEGVGIFIRAALAKGR
jgi:hypothetical protein